MSNETKRTEKQAEYVREAPKNKKSKSSATEKAHNKSKSSKDQIRPRVERWRVDRGLSSKPTAIAVRDARP